MKVYQCGSSGEKDILNSSKFHKSGVYQQMIVLRMPNKRKCNAVFQSLRTTACAPRLLKMPVKTTLESRGVANANSIEICVRA